MSDMRNIINTIATLNILKESPLKEADRWMMTGDDDQKEIWTNPETGAIKHVFKKNAATATLVKKTDSDFTIKTNTGTLDISRADLIALLGQVPTTLLPRR